MRCMLCHSVLRLVGNTRETQIFRINVWNLVRFITCKTQTLPYILYNWLNVCYVK